MTVKMGLVLNREELSNSKVKILAQNRPAMLHFLQPVLKLEDGQHLALLLEEIPPYYKAEDLRPP